MSKIKAKWTSILLALCCVFACLSVGVAVCKNYAIKTNAATTTYTITYLSPLGSSTNEVIQAYTIKDGDYFKPVNSWDYAFGSKDLFDWLLSKQRTCSHLAGEDKYTDSKLFG